MKQLLTVLMLLACVILMVNCTQKPETTTTTLSKSISSTSTTVTTSTSKQESSTNEPLTTTVNDKTPTTMPNDSVPATTEKNDIVSSLTADTEAPLVTSTEKPVITTKPVTTVKPVTTDKPVATTKPIATTKPVTTQPAVTEPVTYSGKNFMSGIADSTSLSKIVLPGTHDSGATKDMILSGTAKCQNLTIAEQLNAGVRYFDIRLKRENGVLKVYHGTVDQKLTFEEVTTAFYEFLQANPSEALIVCIKEETEASGTNDNFDVMVKKHIDKNGSYWFTGSYIPTLGQVRGKIVLMRRYGTSGAYGFNASSGWSDNTTFTLTQGSYKLAVQDYYDNESADKKWESVEAFFAQMKAPQSNTYYLNNTSGYKSNFLGIPNINTIANSVNPKLSTYLDSADGIVGIIATDFMSAELAEKIWQLNF